MKYLLSKQIDFSKIKIKENHKIFKILYVNYNSITIYGLLLKLTNIDIKYENNDFYIYVKPESILYKIDNYLNNNIRNYSQIINENKFTINNSDKLKDYCDNNKTELFINIKYILKNKENTPIINII